MPTMLYPTSGRTTSLNETTKRNGFVRRLGNGRVLVKIIEPGQGSSGFYTPDVLKQAAADGVFDNAPVMRNHPETGNRTEKPDIDLTVGYIEPGPKYLEDGPKGPGLYGPAAILEPYRRTVYSLVDTPFGLSIHADGDLERFQDPTSNVTKITKVHSVDIVVKPGAGGAIVEILESETLNPISEEQMMPNRLFEDNRGNQYLHVGNIYESDDGSGGGGSGSIFDDGLEEDDIQEMRGGMALRRAGQAARSAGSRGRRAASSAKERGMRAAGTARDRGRSVMSGRGGMALAGAGGGAAGGAAVMSRRRKEEMDESEEQDIFEDEQGNRFAFLGNVNEEEGIEEDDLQEKSMALRALGTKMRGRQAMGQVQYQGRRARAWAKRNPGKAAGAAGAAGAAAGAMGSRRKESEDDNIFEDENGDQFILVGNIHEDNDSQEMGHIEESIDDLYEQIAEMQHGPERRRRMAEAANISTVGSYGSRRLVEQIAVDYADNPREAQKIGRAIGRAIAEDRSARNSGWATQESPRWDDTKNSVPAGSGAGFWSSGGGNVGLQEEKDPFETDFMDANFR